MTLHLTGSQDNVIVGQIRAQNQNKSVNRSRSKLRPVDFIWVINIAAISFHELFSVVML